MLLMVACTERLPWWPGESWCSASRRVQRHRASTLLHQAAPAAGRQLGTPTANHSRRPTSVDTALTDLSECLLRLFQASFLGRGNFSSHKTYNFAPPQTAAKLCSKSFCSRDYELFVIKQSKGRKYMPKMHHNTFGSWAPLGSAWGSYILPRSLSCNGGLLHARASSNMLTTWHVVNH